MSRVLRYTPPQTLDARPDIGQVWVDDDNRVFVVDNLGIEQEGLYYGGKAIRWARPDAIPGESHVMALAEFKSQNRAQRARARLARMPARLQVLDTCAKALAVTEQEWQESGKTGEPTPEWLARAVVAALNERFIEEGS